MKVDRYVNRSSNKVADWAAKQVTETNGDLETKTKQNPN